MTLLVIAGVHLRSCYDAQYSRMFIDFTEKADGQC